MSSIVVIHGPQGCGKTRNAQALAAHSGYSRIVDDWDGRSKIEDGCLVLINSIPFGFKVPPLPVGFRGAALVDEASAHHGLHRVRSSMVAGGATFGEKEFQRGAGALSMGGQPDGRRVEQNSQVEQFFDCSTGLKPSNHAGSSGLSRAVVQFLRKGQSGKILTAQSPSTFLFPPSSSFSISPLLSSTFFFKPL